MSELASFMTELLDAGGAVVQPLDAGEIEVLSPAPVQAVLGVPELARLSFGPGRGAGAVAVNLEGDWLDRIGRLLGGRGRWLERALECADMQPRQPERIVDRALELPNAVWRLQGMRSASAPCFLLAFRYAALSDEKREGVMWAGVNGATGAVLGPVLPCLRAAAVEAGERTTISVPATSVDDVETVAKKAGAQLKAEIAVELEPFLRAMRRRLERDNARVHGYHDDLRRESLKRLAQLKAGERRNDEPAMKREQLRIAAIEREYAAKLADLKRNYALRIEVEWVQALLLHVPVQRFDILVKRRKKERLIAMDWHVPVRAMELPPCEAGAGLSAVRLACDEALHLTEPAGQAPCSACGKEFCRACHPQACPRCGTRCAAHAGGLEAA
jgi:hypothetical protein